MNNDTGTASVQPEGTNLPPPRAFGDSTTLTLPVVGLLACTDASVVDVGTGALPGARTVLRAEMLHVAPDALTITF